MSTAMWAQDLSSHSSGPFVRYTRPGQCVAAADRLTQLYWRDKRSDTLHYRPLTDSAPTTVLHAAQACANRFAVNTVPIHDLPGLFALYLWARQDTLAVAAARRLLTAPANELARERGWTEPGWLLQMLTSFALRARPVRLELVKQYLRQIDSLHTPSTAPWRMSAYVNMAQYATSVGDLTGARDAANAAIRASQAMERSEQIDRVYETVNVYDALAEPTSVLINGAAATAVIDTAWARLSPLRAPGVGVKKNASQQGPSVLMRQLMAMGFMTSDMDPQGAPADVEQQRLRQEINGLRAQYSVIDSAGLPAQATHWYPSPTDSIGWPRRGVVTLFVAVNANCSGSCYDQYAVLRRLHNTFSGSGLQIVLLAGTHGYFRNQPQPNPPQESEVVRGYFLDFLKLPYILGVEETEFSFRGDGMRMNMSGETVRGYFRGGRNAAIVDKDGIVRLTVRLGTLREQLIHDVVAKALR